MNDLNPAQYVASPEVDAIHRRFNRSTRKTAPIEHQIALIEHYLPRMTDEFYPETGVSVSRKARARNTLAFLRDVLDGNQQYGTTRQ